MLHIIRPLVHLTSLGLFGEKSWKPFFISLAVDCSSMSLHGSLLLMSAEEKQEMLRRRIAMLAYIHRSPFYDLKSKTMIVSTLQFSRDNMPLLGSVAKALLNYLDEYQQVYSYTWSNWKKYKYFSNLLILSDSPTASSWDPSSWWGTLELQQHRLHPCLPTLSSHPAVKKSNVVYRRVYHLCYWHHCLC